MAGIPDGSGLSTFIGKKITCQLQTFVVAAGPSERTFIIHPCSHCAAFSSHDAIAGQTFITLVE